MKQLVTAWALVACTLVLGTAGCGDHLFDAANEKTRAVGGTPSGSSSSDKADRAPTSGNVKPDTLESIQGLNGGRDSAAASNQESVPSYGPSTSATTVPVVVDMFDGNTAIKEVKVTDVPDVEPIPKGTTSTTTSTPTPQPTAIPTPPTRAAATSTPPPAPPTTPKFCTRLVTKTFTDGIGIKINSKNHPNSSEDGQCNTSCHWANKGFSGCATRSCRAPGTNNDSLCTQCVYSKQVRETYTCP